MSRDLRQYFHSVARKTSSSDSNFVRAANELCRAGITDMDSLCRLLNEEPAKIVAIRNIGAKSISLIKIICATYCRERGDPT